MTVSVLVPWKPGCPHREAAWEWVQARYPADWQIVTGTDRTESFSRTQAIIDAATRSDGDTLVVADADVWCDGIPEAIDHAALTGWAIPHLYIHRLSPESTIEVLAGADWRGLPLSDDNAQDARPYKGHITDTLAVFQRDVLLAVPPDPRFVGWGQEGDAWRIALKTMVGNPWRGTADLVHLWHPPQERRSRTVGNRENLALYKRYLRAARKPAAIQALIEEATWPATSVSN